MPNKRLRQRGLHYPRLSPQGLYQLLRRGSYTRTRIHEDFYLSSRGRNGKRKTPRDMLRQRLQMRFGVNRIHARIAKPARLQDRNTRIRYGAGISKLLLRRGRGQLHRSRLKDWCSILRPSALRNMVLHRLGRPGIHWLHLLPRHANVHVVVILLHRPRRRGGFGSHNHRF